MEVKSENVFKQRKRKKCVDALEGPNMPKIAGKPKHIVRKRKAKRLSRSAGNHLKYGVGIRWAVNSVPLNILYFVNLILYEGSPVHAQYNLALSSFLYIFIFYFYNIRNTQNV